MHLTECDCGGNAHDEDHANDCAGWRAEVKRLREALRACDEALDEFGCGACAVPPAADVAEVPGAVRGALTTLRSVLAKTRGERDEARAEVERLRESVKNLDELYVGRTDELREALAELRTVAERQREACAEGALAWSRSQDDVAEDKERDSAFCSAEMHREEALMARRISAAVRATPLVTEKP